MRIEMEVSQKPMGYMEYDSMAEIRYDMQVFKRFLKSWKNWILNPQLLVLDIIVQDISKDIIVIVIIVLLNQSIN